MKFFTTPNAKNIIATLGIVTIEKTELTFLLILHFYDYTYCTMSQEVKTTGGENKLSAIEI